MKSQNMSKFWIAIAPSVFKLEHRSKAQNVGNAILPAYSTSGIISSNKITGENLDAVTAVTDSFKMADAFAGDRTGGAVAQTKAQRVEISVWQDRVWVNRLQKIYGPGWRVDLRAKWAIVDPRDAAVTAPLFTAVVQ